MISRPVGAASGAGGSSTGASPQQADPPYFQPMRVRRTAPSTLVLALVCSALVGGCSARDARPVSLPRVASSSSVVAEGVPAAAAAATPSGAAAFTRFWYSEITRAWAARDPDIIRGLSAPGCEVCDRYISSMTGARQRNEHVEGVVFTLRLVESQAIEQGVARVSVIYDEPARRALDAAGKVVLREPAFHGRQQTVTLIRSGASWRVKDVS